MAILVLDTNHPVNVSHGSYLLKNRRGYKHRSAHSPIGLPGTFVPGKCVVVIRAVQRECRPDRQGGGAQTS